MDVNAKITALRKIMRERCIDAYIVFSEDAHQSEYVAGYWRCREWISGFDGSAGTVAVTADKAVLWVDGRYYIQAACQIKNSDFKMIKTGPSGADICQWLATELTESSVVGFNGRTLSVSGFEKFESMDLKLKFIVTEDLVGEIWKDRPELPLAPIFEHQVEFAGESRTEKLARVREKLAKKGADCYLISSLDDIAWLYNLRGADIKSTPVFYGFAFVDMSRAYLFVEPVKLDQTLEATLKSEHITLLPYSEIDRFLNEYEHTGSLYIDPDRISVYLKSKLPGCVKICKGTDIITTVKAIKSKKELRNLENAQIKDGLAMVKFLKWIKESVGVIELEEADIHDKLMALRAEQACFIGESFISIAAYMENAAAMHYTPVKGKSAAIKPKGFLLVDSGGQYLDGTTDITRTIVLGEISEEMRFDFTITLKSHIALASAKFLYGAHASYLDAFARHIMWQHGMDYKSGTGHGVGYFLSVHEGPQRFRMTTDSVIMEPGMVTTNEPGVYKEGKWGIRTENTLLAVDCCSTDDGRFLKFETISYCPIDLDGIDIQMLTGEELEWLNSYHTMVFSKLSPFLDKEHRDWLKENTREIS